jgi:beta-1,4-mannosyl-glycoprotein beta-1,4-N-acetylglucosaminyltransferase
MLEIRLNELDPIVDKFVIVESLEMHANLKTKPAIFETNRERFKKFEHKISYTILPHLFPAYDGTKESGWKRENYQRTALMAPVVEASSSLNDIVILSDCDEIPRMTAIRDNIPSLSEKIHMLKLDMYYYNVNHWKQFWPRSSAGPLRAFQEARGFQVVRDGGASGVGLINDAGWHFSYFGDAPRVRLKIESIAENYFPGCQDLLKLSDTQITERMAQGQDIIMRPDSHLTKRDTNDPRLPSYFLSNLNKYPNFWIP